MNTVSSKLESYGVFSPDVIEAVAEHAERQRQFSDYQQVFEAVGLGSPKRVQYEGYLPTDIVDIRPPEHDPRHALFVRLAMANPLDPNQLFQVATIAGTNPSTRVIAVGNPSGAGYDGGRLTLGQQIKVAFGNLAPVVDPSIKYAEQEGIEIVDEAGYSYGADLTVAASSRGAYEVGRAVAIEPASVKKRNIYTLGRAFESTLEELDRYVGESESPAFISAREDSVNDKEYKRGLFRPSNIAVAFGLAEAGFEKRSQEALRAQPGMRESIIWGSKSELALDGLTLAIVGRLRSEFGSDRIKSLRLEGAKHALANNIHLQAAIVLESLK